MNKSILIAAGILMAVSGAARAESQIYSPYGVATNYAAQTTPQIFNDPAAQPAPAANSYMVYPGREEYGDRFGRIPRHPGDYRDAVDRGSWPSGGGEAAGSRAFDIR